jgi:dienelactone hydrolase
MPSETRASMDQLRSEIRSFLGLADSGLGAAPVVDDEVSGDGFLRKSVSYVSDGESVKALLFEPVQDRRGGAVVALHQHNSQWHLGKSEVAGLVGDPFQAFGPALARAGVTVLAPDAVGFESRCGVVGQRSSPVLAPPLNPDRGSTADDWLQYYNHAMHRLAQGDLLMRKVLTDVESAASALRSLTNASDVGVIGHSYGGNVALFAAALDARVAFAVSSGAACSYRYKLAHGIGLEMALVIPGFAAQFDLDELIRCVAPRKLLIVSSEEDPFAADADDLVARAMPTFARQGAADRLWHLRTPGRHALDSRRFNAIVDWVSSQS